MELFIPRRAPRAGVATRGVEGAPGQLRRDHLH
jgi:hypothetical protein